MNNWGVCCQIGEGCEKDEETAVKLYEKAADMGNSFGN